MTKGQVQVYAVVRLDSNAHPGPLSVTVKEVLSEEEQAAREVERLNRIKASDRVQYFWQATRFFPSGRVVQ